jgi:ATP-dependent helicase HrpB
LAVGCWNLEFARVTNADYPVLDVYRELADSLTTNPIVILQAPPGAGKSTVVPLELLKEPWLGAKKIIMLEPRRLAASLVARRMAFLMEDEIGKTVGYRIRFESKVSAATRVEVVTEGILTRMIQSDTALTDVGLVIFDEFHERSLQADLALALCRQVQQVLRPDLKILIMSATIDAGKLSASLSNAPVITSTGKQYPVERRYAPMDKDVPLPQGVARAIMKVAREESGDMLVFLPGAGEIRRTQQILEEGAAPFQVHTLYGDMPFAKQQETLVPDAYGSRKVILSTSIAETSVTIQGIRIVVDAGFSRGSKFDPRNGLSRLDTVRVTRDAADQRAGRAGRLGPGICYRLWPEATHQHLISQRSPEILDADLSSLVLELALWGSADVKQLEWVTPPPTGAVSQAITLLQDLEALEGLKLTKKGREMLTLPTHPRIAHMLIEAVELGKDHLAAAADVAAILEERDPLPTGSGADISLRMESMRRRRQGMSATGDHATLDRLEKLASSWRQRFHVDKSEKQISHYAVGRLIAAAYPERIARQETRQGERYKLANGRAALLPKNDSLVTEPWLAVAHVDAGADTGKIFMAEALDPKDLESISKEREIVSWDDERGMVKGLRQKGVGGLVISSAPLAKIDEAIRIKVLCTVITERGLSWLGWGDSERGWQARVMSLRSWRGQDWPDVSDDALLSTLQNWLTPFLTLVTKKQDLERLDWSSILPTLLPWELQSKLDKLAPEKLEVPTGSMIRIQYKPDGGDPHIEVRLQELFGLLETPAVNEGKNKIVVHLLSPGYKPVQVTRDLRSFWTTTYHEVRRELKIRYPRHSWPEDPFTAKAVRGVKRRV